MHAFVILDCGVGVWRLLVDYVLWLEEVVGACDVLQALGLERGERADLAVLLALVSIDLTIYLTHYVIQWMLRILRLLHLIELIEVMPLTS